MRIQNFHFMMMNYTRSFLVFIFASGYCLVEGINIFFITLHYSFMICGGVVLLLSAIEALVSRKLYLKRGKKVDLLLYLPYVLHIISIVWFITAYVLFILIYSKKGLKPNIAISQGLYFMFTGLIVNVAYNLFCLEVRRIKDENS